MEATYTVTIDRERATIVKTVPSGISGPHGYINSTDVHTVADFVARYGFKFVTGFAPVDAFDGTWWTATIEPVDAETAMPATYEWNAK